MKCTNCKHYSHYQHDCKIGWSICNPEWEDRDCEDFDEDGP